MNNGLIEARFSLRLAAAEAAFSLDVDLSLPADGTTAIFGPSGAGKTTLLRCIAGLQPCPGTLRVDGECWQDAQTCLPAHRRPVGYVFQQPGLFEHLSVSGNLEFARRRALPGAGSVDVDGVVALMGIGHLLDARPARLSGGEQQRVAIARALLSRPRLLLLDEPLASLDAPRKREILPFLETLSREAGLPILYVSHSLDEVMRLADRVVTMAGGRVQRVGTVADVLGDVDGGLGDARAGVVLETSVVETDADWGLSRVAFDGGSLWLAAGAREPGERLRVRVLATDVSVARSRATDSSIVNILPATVSAIDASGDPAKRMLRLRVGESVFAAELTRRSVSALDLATDDAVWIQVKSAAILS